MPVVIFHGFARRLVSDKPAQPRRLLVLRTGAGGAAGHHTHGAALRARSVAAPGIVLAERVGRVPPEWLWVVRTFVAAIGVAATAAAGTTLKYINMYYTEYVLGRNAAVR